MGNEIEYEWLCGKCQTVLEGNQCSHVGWLECPNCGESYRTADLEEHAIKKQKYSNKIETVKKIVSDKKKIRKHVQDGGSIEDLDKDEFNFRQPI